MHARSHTCTHMHQQLTLPNMKHSSLTATANEKPISSKGLHYHTVHIRACRYIQLQNHPEQPISHTYEKIRGGVPLSIAKFTEGGVPDSEIRGQKKGRKRARKERWQCEFCSSVNNFQKSDQWHLFLGCVKKKCWTT